MPDDLTTIRERLSDALEHCPLPWEAVTDPDLYEEWAVLHPVNRYSHVRVACEIPDEARSRFIQHAPTDIAALITAVEERDAEIERLHRADEDARRDLAQRLGMDLHAGPPCLEDFGEEIQRLRAAVQRVRDDTGWCPVCDVHHNDPTEDCP